MAGLEVDAMYPVAGIFNDVIVAQVVKTRPHPEADRLTICDVDIGKSTLLQVVCGASNVRPGLNVALAMVGANLPGGIKIKASKLRGELSEGMLCSTTELGIDDRSEGILELPNDAPIGIDIRDYLVLNDMVFDIDLTPNRADCLSVLGITRELAALNRLPLNEKPSDLAPITIKDTLNVNLISAEACPQYAGRVIRGINSNAVTPIWMKERLRRAGVRALHPVIDITNYVMLELGQPMHAFDLSCIEGDINVRYSNLGETIVLLNGQEVTLEPKVLVIADNKNPLAIAGVMGGQESSVQSHTTDVFIESAFFNPLAIAGVARSYSLSSDSSQRYERGVDPNIQCLALERATYLLHSIVGGEIGPVVLVNDSSHIPSTACVLFKPSSVLRLTGVDIAPDDMEEMLILLGMRVVCRQDVWEVTIPSHRFDISLEVDLVEEIIRLHGYNHIPSTVLQVNMQAGQINAHDRLLNTIALFLSNKGYCETISYSFVDPELQQVLYPDKQTMQLLNPISPELSEMRVGLWSGLLASMLYNAHRQQSALKLFESGVVFDVIDGHVHESPKIAGLMMGDYGQLNWSEKSGSYDFFDMKGDLQALMQLLNHRDVKFVKDTHSSLHPGKSARVVLGDADIGWIGVLHPRFMDVFDLNNEVMLFELSLTPLLNDKVVSYLPISKYPQTRRDLSLIVNENTCAMDIDSAIREVVDSSILKAVDVFDVYAGESIPNGKKSLAIALTLQNDNRTLVDTEINSMMDLILQTLNSRFSIVLRTV